MARAPQAAACFPRLARLGPSAAGLALIPLAVPHIDEAVTRWFDAHLRPRLPRHGAAPAASGPQHASEPRL